MPQNIQNHKTVLQRMAMTMHKYELDIPKNKI